jgi:hypothetical protein
MSRQVIAEQPSIASRTEESQERKATPVLSAERQDDFLRRTVLLALAYALPAVFAITTLTLGAGSANPDLWWHLATGRWIVEHHALLRTDPFSAFGMGKPYVAYSWLYGLVIYRAYSWFGLVGPAVCVVLLASAIGMVLYEAIRRRMGGFSGPIALTAAGAVMLMRFFSAMPLLVSILLFAIEMDILFGEIVDEPRKSQRWRVWLLPVLFVLWVNIHVQFIYGLAVLVFAAVMQGVALARGPEGLQLAVAPTANRFKLWLVTATSVAATFLNPYSWRIYGVVLAYARDHIPFKYVTELRAPNFRSPVDYLLILTVLLAAFILGRVRFRGNLFAGVLLAGTTVVSLRAQHDEWAVLVVALLIIAVGCRRFGPELTVPRRQRVFAALLALLFVLAWAKRRDVSDRRLEADAAASFPEKAAGFVLQQGLRGPLFNDFNWGGYLIWRLPGLPVSMDGRTNVHGGPRTERNIRTWSCMANWKADADLRSANLVIGPPTVPLAYALKFEPDFQVVYQDATAIVFTRKNPPKVNSETAGSVNPQP